MNRSNWLAGALAILLAASPVILTTSADRCHPPRSSYAVAATTEAATTAVFVAHSNRARTLRSLRLLREIAAYGLIAELKHSRIC